MPEQNTSVQPEPDERPDVHVARRRGLDRLDAATLKACYWPEADVDYGSYKGSAQVFADLVVVALADGYELTRHGLGNQVIDIDGNVNSWGLLWKLLSGSCVVRVQSPRQQWYHHRLEPWVHLVPVQADLSDLIPVLRWCRQHPNRCAAIAAAGQALALEVVASLDDQPRQAVQAHLKQGVA